MQSRDVQLNAPTYLIRFGLDAKETYILKFFGAHFSKKDI